MSLTYTAHVTRKILKFGGLGLVAFTLMWTVTAKVIKSYKAAHPPYVSPTVRYGILPKIVFPQKENQNKNFRLELPNDNFPEFPDQAKVYVIYRSTNIILALDQDKQIAQGFGFVGEPTEIRTGVYEFKNNNLNQTLTMNVLDGSFRLDYPYKNDQMLLSTEGAPTKTQAIEKAESFLKSGNKLADDLIEGEKKVSYWKIGVDGLKAAMAQADGNAARVDFFRKELDSLNILSHSPGVASVSVLVTSSSVEGKQVINADYKNVPIDRESYSTYPLKTAQQAWDELKSGNYFAAMDVTEANIGITEMELAYFEPVTLTNYLQPIYVFKGANNFVAYVSAISDKWTAEDQL